MSSESVIVSAFIIGVGLLLSLGAVQVGTDTQVTEYDIYNESWASYGMLSDVTQNAESQLILSNTTAGSTGYYNSQVFYPEGEKIQIDSVNYFALNLDTRENSLKEANLTIYGHNDKGGIEVEKKVKMENAEKQSVDLGNITNQDLAGYSFRIDMLTEDEGETPTVDSLGFEYTVYQDSRLGGQFAIVLGWFLIFIGLMGMVTDAF